MTDQDEGQETYKWSSMEIAAGCKMYSARSVLRAKIRTNGLQKHHCLVWIAAMLLTTMFIEGLTINIGLFNK